MQILYLHTLKSLLHYFMCDAWLSTTPQLAYTYIYKFCFELLVVRWVLSGLLLPLNSSLNLGRLDNTKVFSCVKAIFATGVPLVEGKGINFRRWLKNIQFAHRLVHNLPPHACRCFLLSESSRHFCSIKFAITVALNTTGTVITTVTTG